MERTKEMCTPRPRWWPAQVRQMKRPSLGVAHLGKGEGWLGGAGVEVGGRGKGEGGRGEVLWGGGGAVSAEGVGRELLEGQELEERGGVSN